MGNAAMTSPITTHVLDQQRGKPAAGMIVKLQRVQDAGVHDLSKRTTNSDGRVTDFLQANALEPGLYRLIFETRGYFEAVGQAEFFYPSVQVDFVVTEQRSHYHVPLLLSPFGYSTYRGS
jgi:5-hydroxyisourate hydrolase